MRGKGSKLGKPCPKVRLSQDKLPIEPLRKSHYIGWDFYVRDYFVREKFVASYSNIYCSKIKKRTVFFVCAFAFRERATPGFVPTRQ